MEKRLPVMPIDKYDEIQSIFSVKILTIVYLWSANKTLDLYKYKCLKQWFGCWHKRTDPFKKSICLMLTLVSIKAFSNLTAIWKSPILSYWRTVTSNYSTVQRCQILKVLKVQGFIFHFGMRHFVWDYSSTDYKQKTVFLQTHTHDLCVTQDSLQCHVAFSRLFVMLSMAIAIHWYNYTTRTTINYFWTTIKL